MLKNYTAEFSERIDYMSWGEFLIVWLAPGLKETHRIAVPVEIKSATAASLWAQRNAPSEGVVGYRLTRPNA